MTLQMRLAEISKKREAKRILVAKILSKKRKK